MRRVLLALALLGAAPALGEEWKEIDYSKVERKIENEPKYQATEQGYALFVLDAEGKFLVWFVQDGNDLYVANKKYASTSAGTTREWTIPELAVPGTEIVHKELHVRTDSDEPAIHFRMLWAGKERVYAGFALDGKRTPWGKSAKEAPIFRPCPLGTFDFQFSDPTTLELGKSKKIYLLAGHKGSNENAFSCVNDQLLVAGKDRIFATLVAKDAKGEKVEVKTEITGHC